MAQQLAASTEEVVYTTSATDVAFIGLCRKAYGAIANYQSDRDWKDGDNTYAGMVEVSRAMMQVCRAILHAEQHLLRVHTALTQRHAAPEFCNPEQDRTAEEQRAAVISGFPKVPPWFRRLFPYSRWGAELNAKVLAS